MKDEERIKNLFEIMKRLDSYLNATNQKVAVVITYCAAVLGWMSLNTSKISSLATVGWIHVLVYCLLFLIVISSCYCLARAAYILFPNTSSSIERVVDDSLIFYGDISAAKGGSRGYHDRVSSVSSDDLIKDLSQQVFTVSKILSGKMAAIQKLVIALVFSNFIPVALLLMALMIDSIVVGSSS